ncbi:MAG: Serine/threonine-protein kinase PknB [Candidatus Scalindua rubra]|uniref:Serine/threonine-protein kinase PknB n=1 Tax=Candidatus Scalindua rubra TaxID=1872076 RepID=A0A1E3X6E3_9BACT|nr:MAG: Serine/threonine-protein kinase PknB [Candidatus Scalindua rubra]
MEIFDRIRKGSKKGADWPDEASKEAEEYLQKKKAIKLPWRYGDSLGDDFKVIALRAGGAGAVFFVESTRFGKRRYAAKTLHGFLKEDYLNQPTNVQKDVADKFLEEALPWFEMGQHANIVSANLLNRVNHPETRRTVPFVFSELIQGGDLRTYLKLTKREENNPPVSPFNKGGGRGILPPLVKGGKGGLGKIAKDALEVALQICHGLIHAYNHGIRAHKDLKPENIMRTGDSIIKVSDFGAGMIYTPGYAAPEQIKADTGIDHCADQFARLLKAATVTHCGDQFPKVYVEDGTINHRADQFAIGIILLEMLKGSHPFPEIIMMARDDREAERFVEEGV